MVKMSSAYAVLCVFGEVRVGTRRDLATFQPSVSQNLPHKMIHILSPPLGESQHLFA